MNNIVEVSQLRSLTMLIVLGLSENKIVDIGPLVEGALVSGEGTLILTGNPLSRQSIEVHIPKLQERGITVVFDE